MRALRVLIALCCAGFAALSIAAVLNFSWTNATTNTDGSAIPATGAGSLTETRITYGTCNAAKTAVVTVLGTVTAPAPGTTIPTPNLAPGIYCGFGQHVNTFGVLSDPSGVASKEIIAPKPNPPQNFSLG